MYSKNQNFQKIFLIKVGLLVQYLRFFFERLHKKKAFEHQNFEMLEFIVLVSLTVTLFSQEMLISTI